MPSWLDILSTLWPIAATITPVLIMGGFFWLKTQFATKADFDRHAENTTDLRAELIRIDGRLTALQNDMESSPTRADMSKQMARFGERLGRLEASTEGLGRQLATTNQYLHTIVEKGLSHDS